MLKREQLRGYQLRAVEFIKENPRCALWVDMGLGKTATVLTAMQELMDEFEVGRVLVIAPLRIARKTWTDELKEWEHLANYGWRTAKIIGPVRDRRSAYQRDADLYLINRENVPWLIDEHFEQQGGKWVQVRPWKWDAVVIDESSSFKNHNSQRFKALKRALPHINRMVQLTGTPTPKGLQDLWAQFYLLDRGRRLGKHITAFRNRWFRPPSYGEFGFQPQEHAEKEIMELVDDIVLSLREKDYLDLPPVVYNVIPVTMGHVASKTYKEFKREEVLELSHGGLIKAVNAGVLWGKLLQLANGAVYHGEDDEPAPGRETSVNQRAPSKAYEVFHDLKIEALLETLDLTPGRALIVYNFRSDRERLIKAMLKKKLNFRVLNDEEDEVRWNNGELDYLLLHPASGGHGLNLHKSGAETIIHFGLNPSLELYQQVNARLAGGHRRQGKSVVIHHIVTEGTVDERVLDILDGKENQQAAVLAAVSEIVKEETSGQ